MLKDIFCTVPDEYFEREDVKSANDELQNIRNRLESHMSEEDKELLIDYDNKQSQCSSFEVTLFFVRGIRCGFQLYRELMIENEQL